MSFMQELSLKFVHSRYSEVEVSATIQESIEKLYAKKEQGAALIDLFQHMVQTNESLEHPALRQYVFAVRDFLIEKKERGSLAARVAESFELYAKKLQALLEEEKGDCNPAQHDQVQQQLQEAAPEVFGRGISDLTADYTIPSPEQLAAFEAEMKSHATCKTLYVEPFLSQLQRMGPHFKTLNFKGWNFWKFCEPWKELERFLKFFPNLNSLNFSDAAFVERKGEKLVKWNMIDRALNIVARVLPHLQELDISGTGLYRLEYPGEDEDPMFPNLKVLKMDLSTRQLLRIHGISFGSFPSIPTLQFLSVRTPELSGFWMDVVLSFWRGEVTKFPELVEIDATGATFGEKHGEELVQTLSQFTKLKKVHLAGSDVAKKPDLVKRLQTQYPNITFVV